MENIAYIALGSNIGERHQYLQGAIQKLNEHSQIDLVSISSIYETDPVGYTEQDSFLNMVVSVITALSPHELLAQCMKIELELGRKREKVWGPRTIDLDILLYNQENIESETLIIPHPRMRERAFVLVPLIEIAPELPFSWVDKINIIELQEKEGVRLWKQKNGGEELGPFES